MSCSSQTASSRRRLRRLVCIETIIFNTEGPTIANALRILGREKLIVLSRYEVSLERSLYRALHELQRLQALREGRAVPPPAVVDVDVSVSGPVEANKAIPAH